MALPQSEDPWYYGHQPIVIWTSFNYLGVIFTQNGINNEVLENQATKSLVGLYVNLKSICTFQSAVFVRLFHVRLRDIYRLLLTRM